MESILTSTKKVLGVAESDTTFDVDIILHINSAFATLAQLGVGPLEGFEIEDDTAVWDDLLGTSPRFNNAKAFTYLYVRQLFDPPQTGYLVEALQKQMDELVWRLNIAREETDWEDPSDPQLDPDEPDSLDGGGP